MKKTIWSNMLVTIAIAFSISLFTACSKSSDTTFPITVGNSFTEEFDTVQSAYDRGWRMLNKSYPQGRLWVYGGSPTFPVYLVSIYPYDDLRYYPGWHQAESGIYYDPTTTPITPYAFSFPAAYSSTSTNLGYIASSWACNTNITFGTPDPKPAYINNWLVSPEITMKNEDKIIFYARCDTTARLQVRINKNNESFTAVGNSLDSSGDFNTLLLDINPTYLPSGMNAFPKEWTRFEATVQGLNNPVKGRFAFRYMVNGNPEGVITPADLDVTVVSPFIQNLYDDLAKSVIGIDKVQYVSK